jgi:hypothetical protein
MRFLLPALALASCTQMAPPSATADNVREAIARATQLDPKLPPVMPASLRGAAVAATGACHALGADQQCAVTFQRANGARVETDVWISKSPSGWIARSVTLK